MPNDQHLMDESQVPDNWVSAEVAKATPPAPPARPDMPMFFSGSLPPNIQHDTSFVGTKTGSSRIPTHSLMPLGVQANPASNAGVQSTVIKQINNNVGSNITLQTNGSNNPNQQILDLEPGTSNVSMSADSSGAVRVSVISEPAYLQIQSGRIWSDAIIDISSSSPVSSGISSSLSFTSFGGAFSGPTFSSTETPYYAFRAGINASSYTSMYSTTAVFRINANPLIASAFKLSITSNIRIWFGLFSGTGSNLNTGNNNPPGELVAFLSDTSTFLNWQCVTQNGVIQTFVDSGVLVDGNNHVFTILVDNTVGSVTYFIDSIKVGTISTSKPNATTSLRPIVYAESINNLGANQDILHFKNWYAEEDSQ